MNLKLFGITGYPLGHSISPDLHNWAFKVMGFPGVYLAWPQPENKLSAFFMAVRALGISGGNITIPHKVASMEFVDCYSERAKSIGAINTFYWRDNSLWGENTDIAGFMAPIKHKKFAHALVLGAGGASRAVLAGLTELKVPHISITNRGPEKAQMLAELYNAEFLPWHERMDTDADLIINATPLGMNGARENMTPYDASAFAGKKGLVYDIVYNPLETKLLKDAKNAGWEVQNGLAMFVEQAREAFRLWTGQEMPLDGAMAKCRELLKL